MRFDVAALLRGSTGSTRSYRLEEQQAGASGSGLRVAGTVSLLRTRRGILVTAHLRVNVPDRCSRCLAPLDTAFDLDIQEEYTPTVDARTGSRLPLPYDGDSFCIDDQQVLDLSEAVRQYQLAAQPMQPLCHADCKGLCPHCGHNLNLGPCSCSPAQVDSRWAALAQLSDTGASTSDRKGGV